LEIGQRGRNGKLDDIISHVDAAGAFSFDILMVDFQTFSKSQPTRSFKNQN
jgi:hypothetical protein